MFQPLVSAAVPAQCVVLPQELTKAVAVRAAFRVPGAALESSEAPLQYYAMLRPLIGA